MSNLIKYDAMVLAIAECHQVDELKDLHDKAAAMELYFRQALNTDAERQAGEIRLRAERKAGELLKELARATPGGDYTSKEAKELIGNDVRLAPSPYREAIENANIHPRTATRWQKLANIPTAEFEAALADPTSKPTTSKLIREIQRDVTPIDQDALWIWGNICQLDRMGHLDRDAQYLYQSMTGTMQSDMQRVIPKVIAFFSTFKEILDEHSRRS